MGYVVTQLSGSHREYLYSQFAPCCLPLVQAQNMLGLLPHFCLTGLIFHDYCRLGFWEKVSPGIAGVIFYRTDAVADAQITVTTSKLSNYHMCNVYHLINNIETV